MVNGCELKPYAPERGPKTLGALWTKHKGALTIRCVLCTHPAGWELKLTAADHFFRSQVCKTSGETYATSDAWQAEATAKGWT